MTFTTLFAAMAAIKAVAIAPEMHALNGVPMAASFVASDAALNRDGRAYVLDQSRARIKPLQPQDDEALSLGDAFKVKRGGFIFSLTAYKPKSLKDVTTVKGTRRMRSHRRQMRAMGKAMPGYPQPVKAVVAVKVAF